MVIGYADGCAVAASWRVTAPAPASASASASTMANPDAVSTAFITSTDDGGGGSGDGSCSGAAEAGESPFTSVQEFRIGVEPVQRLLAIPPPHRVGQTAVYANSDSDAVLHVPLPASSSAAAAAAANPAAVAALPLVCTPVVTVGPTTVSTVSPESDGSDTARLFGSVGSRRRHVCVLHGYRRDSNGNGDGDGEGDGESKGEGGGADEVCMGWVSDEGALSVGRLQLNGPKGGHTGYWRRRRIGMSVTHVLYCPHMDLILIRYAANGAGNRKCVPAHSSRRTDGARRAVCMQAHLQRVECVNLGVHYRSRPRPQPTSHHPSHMTVARTARARAGSICMSLLGPCHAVGLNGSHRTRSPPRSLLRPPRRSLVGSAPEVE